MPRWIIGVGLLIAACGDDRVAGADAALDAVPPVDAAPLCSTDSAATDGETVMLAARDVLLAYYQAHQEFPQGSIGPTPATGCCAQDFLGGGCCAPVAADWDAALWRTVGLAVTAPSAYQFRYVSDTPSTCQLIGTRDQDCDSIEATVVVACSATVQDGPTCTLIRPAVPE